VGVGGEDVEDDRRAIDHGKAERGLEVALLARGQLVVTGDQVGVRAGQLGLQLVELARAEIGVGMRVVAPLDQLPDAGHARGAQQLAQLGELLLVAVRNDRHQVGTLPCSAAVQSRMAARLIVSRHKS
jgi:hypothetical protein